MLWQIKELEWEFSQWAPFLGPVEVLRDVHTVALRFFFAAYSATEDQAMQSVSIAVKESNTL